MLRWHGRSATPAAAAVAAGAKTAAAGAVAAAGAMAASGAVAVSGLVAVAALAPRALAQPSFRSQSPQPPKASERREVSFTLFFRGPAARFDVNSLQQCNILSDGLVALQSRGQSQSPHTRRAACLHLPVFTRAWPLPPPRHSRPLPSNYSSNCRQARWCRSPCSWQTQCPPSRSRCRRRRAYPATTRMLRVFFIVQPTSRAVACAPRSAPSLPPQVSARACGALSISLSSAPLSSSLPSSRCGRSYLRRSHFRFFPLYLLFSKRKAKTPQ